MKKYEDLTGQKFGRLTVIQRTKNNKYGNLMWLCQCECGKQKIVRGSHLKGKRIQSCGCLAFEIAKEKMIERNFVHGKKGTKIYAIWKAIKQRCFNPNNAMYHNYGGRGITICEEWKNNFQAFYDHVSKLPHFNEKGYSLDRINNDGNYEPNNVKWSTAKEQANNTRTNVFITFKGETHTVAEWSEITGINNKVILERINILHWDVEKALTTPVRKIKKAGK